MMRIAGVIAASLLLVACEGRTDENIQTAVENAGEAVGNFAADAGNEIGNWADAAENRLGNEQNQSEADNRQE